MSFGSRLGLLSTRFRRARNEDLVREASRYLAGAETEEILEWVWETFAPKVALSSSFQQQSLPLLHIASRVVPEMPVLFLDTGFHFPETLSFKAEIEQLLGLRVQIVRPELGHEGFRRIHGELYRSNPDLCCHINKVEPIKQALGSLDAWVTGIRRDQTPARAHARVLSLSSEGIVKVCPMLSWTRRDVWDYINRHDLPSHPLLQHGYLSVGCAPCTRPVTDGADDRCGRWAGSQKTECGLHSDGGGGADDHG